MKPDTTTDYDPIPEGLEFDESYMQAAFDMYDAEKKESKRRLLIWIWSSSVAFATGLVLVILLFTGNSEGTDDKTGVKTATQQPVSPHATFNRNKRTGAQNQSSQSSTKAATQSTKPNQSTLQLPYQQKTSHFTDEQVAYENQEHISDKAIRSIDGQNSSSKSKLSSTPAVVSGRKKSTGFIAFTKFRLPKSMSKATNTAVAGNAYHDSSDSASVSGFHLPPLDETKNHLFYLNTGLNTLFGMSELQSEFHLRETAGIGYDFRFRKSFTLSTNIELYALPKINHYQYIGTGISENDIVSFTKTTLYYITVSPKLDYTFKHKHHLAIGTGMEYLIINPGEKYEIRDYTGSKENTDNSDYYSSFNRFNYFVSLGYGIDLSKRFSFYGTYQFGLTDITVNNSNNSTMDRNSRLQLLLRMRVF